MGSEFSMIGQVRFHEHYDCIHEDCTGALMSWLNVGRMLVLFAVLGSALRGVPRLPTDRSRIVRGGDG